LFDRAFYAAPRSEADAIASLRAGLRILLTVNSLVGLATGAGLLIAPVVVVRLFGLVLGNNGVLGARLLGGEFLGLNVATWLARASDPQVPGTAARALVYGHLGSEASGALVAGWAATSGAGGPLLWLVVATYAGFALAFAWMVRAIRSHAAAPDRSNA